MIKINGYKFAETGKEITDSLFLPGGTVAGTVKRYKRKVVFYGMNDSPFGVICNGVFGGISILENGKLWYSYKKPYFLKDLSYSDIQLVIDSLSIGSDSKGQIFK